ncbi:MAG TPA: hypothetical protein VN736_25765 [Candidatus Limnocylindrales bacterium]|nr:hypothetical protein [Candidatus Limnocylindrales bacterium]
MTPATEAFDAVRNALVRSQVRYAVGGSWASMAHGEVRNTNGVVILVDFTLASLDAFLQNLPATFVVDPDHARESIRLGRSFNAIYVPAVYKFDFFPARGSALGIQPLDRAKPLAGTGLSSEPVPFVSPEDILLAKLHWIRLGGGLSEVQWRDVAGIVNNNRATLDRDYLQRSAATLNLLPLLDRALA